MHPQDAVPAPAEHSIAPLAPAEIGGTISSDTFAEIMHELCVPLSSVCTAVDLLLKDADSFDPRDAANLLHGVRESTRWMQDLVADLASPAPADLGGCRGTRRGGLFNLAQSLQLAVHVAQPLFQPRQLSLNLQIPRRPVVVWGREHLIRRATLNLLANAAKYAPDGDAVTIKLKTDAEAALVEVIDHGNQLSNLDVQRLFEPQTRAAVHVERAVPGQGLGLSIVKTLVEEQGGRVGARVRGNRKTAFWYRLPRLGSRRRSRANAA